MIKHLLLGILMSLVCGCASLNSVSVTPVPGHRAHQVTAQVSKLIILAFSFDNDFIDPLVQELKQRCPNGVISGILTKDETISYVLAHTRRVTATGYCQSAVGLLDKESHSVASDEGTTL